MCVYIYICIVSFHSPPCDINEDMKINAGSNLICKMLFLRWWLVCPSSYPVVPYRSGSPIVWGNNESSSSSM